MRGLVPAPALPLFQWSNARDTGEEPCVALPEMALSEHVVNDYQTLRLSLKAHPMSFLREDFRVAAPSDAPKDFGRWRPAPRGSRQQNANAEEARPNL